MSYIEKEKLIKADIASIENRVRHAFNQGYDFGYKEGKANCSEIPTGSTTKNDCAEQNGCITCSLDYGDDCCRKLFEESMQEPTTKNDLEVDCISRQAVIDARCNK